MSKRRRESPPIMIVRRDKAAFFCNAEGCRRPRTYPFKNEGGLRQHQRTCEAYQLKLLEEYNARMESRRPELKKQRVAEEMIDNPWLAEVLDNNQVCITSFHM